MGSYISYIKLWNILYRKGGMTVGIWYVIYWSYITWPRIWWPLRITEWIFCQKLEGWKQEWISHHLFQWFFSRICLPHHCNSESCGFRGAIFYNGDDSNKGQTQSPIKRLDKSSSGHFKFLMPKGQRTWKVRIPARIITANNQEEVEFLYTIKTGENAFSNKCIFRCVPWYSLALFWP